MLKYSASMLGNKKSFTHVFNDDKFVDSAIRLFESVRPRQSTYYILSDSSSFTYVKSQNVTAISIKTEVEAKNFVDDFCGDHTVLLHALCPIKQWIVLNLKPEIISVWLVWGYDLYRQWPFFKRDQYEKKTAKFINQGKAWQRFKDHIKYNKFTKTLFFQSPDNFIGDKISSWYESQFYTAAKRINILAPIVPTEYEFVSGMGLKPILGPFNYSCVEWLSSGEKLHVNANNLLVGNSADPSNNHIEIFEIISKLKLGNHKVYVPLSYGGTEKYREFILKKGSEILGDNFYPLQTFMPLVDYNQIVAECSLVFFHHRRQQALGNILSSLQMGAKVFLNAKSPVLKYFLSIGFNIGNCNLVSPQDLCPLESSEVNKNMKLLQEYYSLNAVQNKVEELMSIIEINLKK